MIDLRWQRSAAYLLVAMIVFPCACARQSTVQQRPVRSFDDLFSEIVRTDWQTQFQWDSSSPNPPPEFIAKVFEGIELRPLDVDGDGLDEFVLCLNYSPGQKPINQTFYILRNLGGGWQLIAEKASRNSRQTQRRYEA
jgi:hypothetical protein